MHHIPGIKNRAPDTVSRYPTGSQIPDKMHLPDDVAHIDDDQSISALIPFVTPPLHRMIYDEAPPTVRTIDTNAAVEEGIRFAAISTINSLQSVSWDRVRLATASDTNMKHLVEIIESGMPPNRQDLPLDLQPYHQFRENLSTVDGVAVYRDRIIIPPQLRKDILAALHAAHHGVTSMTGRAVSSVFWPGMITAIIQQRSNCSHCNRMAPSQPDAPPSPLNYPEYPFQYICADFFHYKGHYYLVCVDRYSNWPIVEESSGGAQSLINILRRTFATYGIPDELSSDGGPEFIAASTKSFLNNWGVSHRLSSVAFPHSNCRAEVGVKTVKRMITDNTGPNGELDTDALQRAVLQHRNTPNQDTTMSPVMCLFGRPIKDFIPILPGKYKPHPTWQSTLRDRGGALRNRHMKVAERLSEHTRRLPPLLVGDRVRIQNQIGPNPRKWDKTGSVVEVKQYDQYVVRTDGSGRVTLRNRKFLRKYVPVRQPTPPVSILDTQNVPQPIPATTGHTCLQPTSSNTPMPSTGPLPSDDPPTPRSVHQEPTSPDIPLDSEPPVEPCPAPLGLLPPRRSTRDRRQPCKLKDYELT